MKQCDMTDNIQNNQSSFQKPMANKKKEEKYGLLKTDVKVLFKRIDWFNDP